MVSIDGVNYGDLVRVYVGGVNAYIDRWYLQRVPQAVLVGEYDPTRPALVDFCVKIDHGPSQTSFYVVERTDALKLGRVLSELYANVVVYSHARYLVRWVDGVESVHRTLDDYYTNITPEELAATALE